MKCPRCDSDISDKKICSECGFDVEGFRKNLEVEYKDFKTSELLEIRHKKQTAYGSEEKSDAGTYAEKQAPGGETSSEAPGKGEKKPFPVLSAIALILLLIAGGFFLFRYFIIR